MSSMATTRPASCSLSHHDLFGQMAALIEAPGYPFLTSYKKDFYELDKAYLAQNWVPKARMLWVIKPMGTVLVRIGVHSKLNEHASAAIRAALRESREGCEIYLVSDRGLKKIDADRAKIELLKMDFNVGQNAISDAGGNLIATFEVRRRLDKQHQRGSAYFGSAHGVNITYEQRVALRHIANCELIREWGSFFCSLDEIYLDGSPMFKGDE